MAGTAKTNRRTNIYLIGFMGCGKSTIAACMRREYKKEQLEMDGELEKEEGRTIPEIFAAEGEEYFRNLETGLLKRLGERENLVISCGGGVPMREENVREMKRNGRVVLLLAEPRTIYNRVKNAHNRPLLEGNMNVEYISALMERRMEAYKNAADIEVRTDGREASDICKEIIEKMDAAWTECACKRK